MTEESILTQVKEQKNEEQQEDQIPQTPETEFLCGKGFSETEKEKVIKNKLKKTLKIIQKSKENLYDLKNEANYLMK